MTGDDAVPSSTDFHSKGHERRSAVSNFLLLSRPREWLKNVLVAAGPLSAGAFTRPIMYKTAVAFVAITLMAIAGYAWNDLSDRILDVEHAVRRRRPIASGALTIRSARVFMAMTACGSLAIASAEGKKLVVSIATYGALTFSYSRWLKHLAVVELLTVSTCIVFRTEIGSLATRVPLSTWFLLVVGFAALYVVTSKRSSEILAGYDPKKTRPVLAKYPAGFLDFVRILSMTGTVVTYSMWAFERSNVIRASPWLELSIPLMIGGLLRFELLVRAGRAGTVEDVLFDDRIFRWTALIWSGVFLLGTFQV